MLANVAEAVLGFDRVLAQARERARARPVKIAVACAQDADVMAGLKLAYESGIAQPILVGNEPAIREAAEEVGFDTCRAVLIHEPNERAAAARSVRLVSSGEADILMKGKTSTAAVLSAALDREHGLRSGRLLSHVAAFQPHGSDRLFLFSDGAMVICPDLRQKVEITRNAIQVARRLGLDCPKVAVLAAVESVNPDMPATLDAASLAKMGDRGEFGEAVVDGPLALDNAVSVEAARHKGIASPVAGCADVLIVPDIEAGNIFYKSLVYFGGIRSAGVVVGATAPIIITSRADTADTKLNSIALAACVQD